MIPYNIELTDEEERILDEIWTPKPSTAEDATETPEQPDESAPTKDAGVAGDERQPPTP